MGRNFFDKKKMFIIPVVVITIIFVLFGFGINMLISNKAFNCTTTNQSNDGKKYMDNKQNSDKEESKKEESEQDEANVKEEVNTSNDNENYVEIIKKPSTVIDSNKEISVETDDMESLIIDVKYDICGSVIEMLSKLLESGKLIFQIEQKENIKEEINDVKDNEEPEEIIKEPSTVIDPDEETNGETSDTTISNVDETKPEMTIGEIETTTSSIKIPFNAIDEETGIKEVTCEYGEDETYGNVGKIENGVCIIEGLESDKIYYYRLSSINGIDNETTYSNKQQTGLSSISFNETQDPLNQEWATKKILAIDFKTKNINNYEYYIKFSSMIDLTKAPTHVCGENVEPGNCTANTSKTLNPKTWYKVDNDLLVEFTQNNNLVL